MTELLAAEVHDVPVIEVQGTTRPMHNVHVVPPMNSWWHYVPKDAARVPAAEDLQVIAMGAQKPPMKSPLVKQARRGC